MIDTHPRLALRAALTAVACLGGLGTAHATPSDSAGPAGHWEGSAAIPGATLPLVLDLARDAQGAWAGSATLPGRRAQGVPLRQLAVGADGRVEADLGEAFGGPPSKLPTTLVVRMLPDQRLEGEWRQGGHTAPLTLRRQGEAQVERPTVPAPLAPGLAGVWRGRYELGGYPREVTLRLVPRAPGASSDGELLIVGRRSTRLPVDRVTVGQGYLSLDADGADFHIEGRWDMARGEIDGEMRQGPFEARLLLRRDTLAPRTGSGT
ncbi:MAG: hypothetical protein U1F53_09030 [Burkholderiaceae bacterium]